MQKTVTQRRSQSYNSNVSDATEILHLRARVRQRGSSGFFLIDADEFVGIGKTLKKTVLVSTDERRSLLTTPLVLVSFNSQIYNLIWPGL